MKEESLEIKQIPEPDNPQAVVIATVRDESGVRQDLGQFKTFCPAVSMTDAIGGAFTGNFVHDLCHEEQSHVRHFIRRGTCYIAIEPFLEKLKPGLSFEDAPH